MSVLLNFGADGWHAASASASASRKCLADVVINQQRSEEKRKIRDREAERPLRERIAVRNVDAYCKEQEHPAEYGGGDEIENPAHADRERQQRCAEQDDRVEQHLQPRVFLAVGNRKHRQARLGVLLGAVERERPEVRRSPREDD